MLNARFFVLILMRYRNTRFYCRCKSGLKSHRGWEIDYRVNLCRWRDDMTSYLYFSLVTMVILRLELLWQGFMPCPVAKISKALFNAVCRRNSRVPLLAARMPSLRLANSLLAHQYAHSARCIDAHWRQASGSGGRCDVDELCYQRADDLLLCCRDTLFL